MKTAAERLAQVEAAIEAVEKGQSYTVNGNSYSRADLGTLYAERRILVKEAARQAGAAGRYAVGSTRLNFRDPR